VHGEYRHLCKHKELALQTGMDKKDIFIMSIGKVLELSNDGAKIVGSVPSGRVLVDGLGVGDVGNIVLRDRKHLAEDGIIIVVLTIEKDSGLCISGPEIISRGFVYVREAEDLMESIKDVATDVVETCINGRGTDWTTLKTRVKNEVGNHLYSKTKRKPMILTIIMEV
ncbi:MAG: ribonuclease J, partial [Oscillospiraceae bacterium]